MAIHLNRMKTRLEMKRSELRETIAQQQRFYTADSEPSYGVEDTEETARERVEQEGEQSILAN